MEVLKLALAFVLKSHYESFVHYVSLRENIVVLLGL